MRAALDVPAVSVLAVGDHGAFLGEDALDGREALAPARARRGRPPGAPA